MTVQKYQQSHTEFQFHRKCIGSLEYARVKTLNDDHRAVLQNRPIDIVIDKCSDFLAEAVFNNRIPLRSVWMPICTELPLYTTTNDIVVYHSRIPCLQSCHTPNCLRFLIRWNDVAPRRSL